MLNRVLVSHEAEATRAAILSTASVPCPSTTGHMTSPQSQLKDQFPIPFISPILRPAFPLHLSHHACSLVAAAHPTTVPASHPLIALCSHTSNPPSPGSAGPIPFSSWTLAFSSSPSSTGYTLVRIFRERSGEVMRLSTYVMNSLQADILGYLFL